jgi:outer membrane cobalamin receptor
MKKKLWALAMIIAAALSLGTIQPLMAQDDEAQELMLEEIIVTATKREESIYDVPIAMTAFSEETMFRQGIVDLTDIGKFVPNLNVTGFSAGHVSSVNPFIRGIGLQDHLITTDPGVGVYVDGVYLGRQVGQNWSLANIERVEVLRGPQGTLYGRNTIGGAINIITRATRAAAGSPRKPARVAGWAAISIGTSPLRSPSRPRSPAAGRSVTGWVTSSSTPPPRKSVSWKSGISAWRPVGRPPTRSPSCSLTTRTTAKAACARTPR